MDPWAALERELDSFAGLMEAFGMTVRNFQKRTQSRVVWTPAEEKQLRKLYPDMASHAVAKRLGFRLRQVYQKAARMRLKKSAAFLASPEAYRFSGQDEASRVHRFPKGHKPWNKGMKGLKTPGSEKGWFKKGGKPMNTWKPIGTETVTKDNYLVRKVTDVGGYNNDDWQFVHHLVWEKHHGRRVPPRHLVIFLDKNKRNFRIRNLKLVSYEENMRRNTIHRYPLELKKAIRALGKLNRTIRKQNEKD